MKHKNLRGNLLDKRHRQPRREASPRDTLITLIFLSKLKPNPKTRKGTPIYSLRNKKRDTWAAALNSACRQHGSTVRATVLPRLLPHVLPRRQKIYGSTYGTTATTTARQQKKYGSGYGSSRGTTAPITILPCCLCAETGLRPLYPSLDPLRL